MWNQFNIKTFPAETIVYRDGVFASELSTIKNGVIDKNYDLPIHIIYVGELSGENKLNLDLRAANQKVFVSVNLKNKKPAFLNFLIKNAGKNSEIRGHVIIENGDMFNLNINAKHIATDTTILINTKLVADKNSVTKLSGAAEIEKNATGAAEIEKNATGAVSDISFAALAHKTAKITFIPMQRINSVPKSAEHGAAIFHPSAPQIQFLRASGLSGAEANIAMRDAFINDLPLF